MSADAEQPAALRRISARIAAGDAAAFEQLHSQYGPRLRALFARRLGRSGSLVDDLVQQTWTALW